MKILLHISFLGTAYCGWQKQKNGISVQQTVNNAVNTLFGFECDLTGCSRTDSGVHANDFCAAVTEKGKNSIETAIPLDKIPVAASHFLPHDIAVTAAEAVNDSFHPRYSVKYKEYIYKIYNGEVISPFMYGRVWHYPRPLKENAAELMNNAAGYFCGRHDFTSYMASGSDITDRTRTVMYADVKECDGTFVFRVAADGFLYNTVRIMAGTLVAAGEGKILPSDIESITSACDRKKAGITAPACGLYLNRVVY